MDSEKDKKVYLFASCDFVGERDGVTEMEEANLLGDILPWAEGSLEEMEKVRRMAEKEMQGMVETVRRRSARKEEKEQLMMDIERELMERGEGTW